MACVVCILAAGSGTRLGPRFTASHKALLPIKEKAALAHLFEKLPADTRFVLAVGYNAHLIREYVSLAHADSTVEFVDVSPFQGPGSGPGTSVKACSSYLREPFFVVCADALWNESLPLDSETNWVGVASASPLVSKSYCIVESTDNKVTGFRDKQPPAVISPNLDERVLVH